MRKLWLRKKWGWDTYVSQKVSIKDTKHKSLFGFKELSLFRFTTWSIGGVKDLITFMRLSNYEKASPEAIKVPLICREGYAAISLLIPFLNPMSSIAADE